MMYDKILWAHDAVDLAPEGQDHVQALALAFGSSVIICHVVELTEAILGSETREPAGEVYSLRLETAAARLREAGVADVETVIVEGVPDRALVDLATERSVDLIVVATHGRGVLARAVLGSVSEAVVRNTPGIAVLVLHPPKVED
jgi:nucleotide-binding universal stress UspA family protein